MSYHVDCWENLLFDIKLENFANAEMFDIFLTFHQIRINMKLFYIL